MPEGRDVGKPVRLREWQKDVLRSIYDNPNGTRRAIISFGRKNGKGLALDTPIPTPRGWTTMGSLRVGDDVFGSNGNPTRVEFVSPIHVGLKCWRLTFSDGSSIVADEQHRWLTTHSYRPWAAGRKSGSGNGGRWRSDVVTTPQIAESVHRRRKDGGREHNHKITVAPAIQTDAAELPIDPYVFGAWLGDGTSAAATFTCSEADLSEMCGMLSAGLGGAVRSATYSGRAPTIRTPGLGLQTALRLLGVLGNKHIPDQYLNAGTEQRWSLLRGLMDTDGTVNRHAGKTTARPSYAGTNESLCRGVWRLARSLGLKATFREGVAKLNGKAVGAAYEVSFPACSEHPVFGLARKQALLAGVVGQRAKTLTIVACDPVDSVPTVCIKVAAEDSLFLAGHGCVPTHNTALSAFILLLHLVGPESRPNSQLFSAAQSRDQAAVLFALAAKVVRQSPELNAAIGIRDTAKQLYCEERGTLYRALSADASTAYGLSPVLVVHDELGQVKGPTSELYDALETATGAQEEPLSVVISTQSPTDGDLLSILIDDALGGADPKTVVSLHTAPMDADPFSEEAIKAANPAYGDFLNAEIVRDQAEAARRMPSREAQYRNLILNQRVDQSAPFISRSVWQACGGPVADFDGLPVFAGLDLSETADLTAFVPMAPVDGVWNVRPVFWLPTDGLREKARQDRVPYDVWQKDGFLQATPGPSVDYAFVAAYLWDFCGSNDVRKIGFDRWNWRHLMPWLAKAGFEEAQLDGDAAIFEPIGQGFQTMSPALRDLESVLLNGKLAHGGHPVLTMCAANATVQADPAGNRKLSKIKSHGRIDGMVALAMAMSVAGTFEEAAANDISDFLNDPIMVI